MTNNAFELPPQSITTLTSNELFNAIGAIQEDPVTIQTDLQANQVILANAMGCRLSIMDSSGRCLLNESIGSDNQLVSLAAFNPGIYLLRISGKHSGVSKMLVILH